MFPSSRTWIQEKPDPTRLSKKKKGKGGEINDSKASPYLTESTKDDSPWEERGHSSILKFTLRGSKTGVTKNSEGEKGRAEYEFHHLWATDRKEGTQEGVEGGGKRKGFIKYLP